MRSVGATRRGYSPDITGSNGVQGRSVHLSSSTLIAFNISSRDELAGCFRAV
jgi:hypothetical protein